MITDSTVKTPPSIPNIYEIVVSLEFPEGAILKSLFFKLFSPFSVKSIISRGAVERIYGVLMISAFLMALTGIVFGVIGYHSEEGGVTSKKMAVYLNIVVFVIAGIFFIKGM